MTATNVHPYRKEIARYLLSRGLADFGGMGAEDAALDALPMRAAPIPFPGGDGADARAD